MKRKLRSASWGHDTSPTSAQELLRCVRAAHAMVKRTQLGTAGQQVDSTGKGKQPRHGSILHLERGDDPVVTCMIRAKTEPSSAVAADLDEAKTTWKDAVSALAG
ncbi:MAG: hypothetical protein Q9177_000595 [Variospora cf. flavescens]